MADKNKYGALSPFYCGTGGGGYGHVFCKAFCF